MPELPEVETVARGLQREVTGRRILCVTLGKTDFIDNPADIERELPGSQIQRVERYGKFLLLRLRHSQPKNLDRESALLVHLGMTGMLMPKAAGEPQVKHTHVVMPLDDGRELRYVDPRRFGRIAYLSDDSLVNELQRFGLDPLAAKLDEFVTLVRSRKARIKALLLNQQVLRGVGNIYADESLWKAKLHPAQWGSKLTTAQAKELYRALQAVLRQAIAMRGSSISSFLDADGQPGEYQQRHRVYGREGKGCPRCKTAIRRIVVAGRSSFFCPKCQRAPRKSKRRRRS